MLLYLLFLTFFLVSGVRILEDVASSKVVHWSKVLIVACLIFTIMRYISQQNHESVLFLSGETYKFLKIFTWKQNKRMQSIFFQFEVVWEH